MKKLIFCLFTTLFIPIFIWMVIGYTKYGDDIVNKHLDLYSTMQNLVNMDDSLNSDRFVKIFDYMQNIIDSFNGDFSEDVGKFFKLLITPFKLIIAVFNYIFDIFNCVWNFLFDPVFI